MKGVYKPVLKVLNIVILFISNILQKVPVLNPY